LQVGSGNENNDRINISIGDARTARLGAAPTASVAGDPIKDGLKISEGDITINGFNVIGSTSDGVSIHNSEGSAIAKANAINAISSKTGVVAAAKASVYTFSAEAASTGGDFAFLLNGAVIQGDVEAGSNDVGSASNIAAAINAKTAKTGVVATVSNEAGHEGEFTLTANDGRNIVLSKNTEDLIKATGDSTLVGKWGKTGISAALTGTTTGTGANATTTAPEITSFEIHPGATLDATKNDSAVIYGSIELTTDSLAGITLGGPKALDAVIGVTGEYIPASKSSGSGVGSVNLNTASGAQSALTTLDRAINAVTDMRASMGAYQNRLTASIANLENTSMNLTASRSRILDTDYAKETTNLAKSQIIQQAATAMLAQANQSSQSVLALLK
jgi:flagellin